MEQSKQQESERHDSLAKLLAMVEKAAQAIEQLQAKAELQHRRIMEFEQAESTLRQDAERYRRFRTYVQSLPESEGGFNAHGNSYASFDEAFDAAYAVIRKPE
ncbi:hypothetical protein D3870_19405 [Noviherbaspirillum cavernae]|uniref:Uncharacterized protein n=1 Tax=Noviherbaspirillum cavernae TaxID=2320862 RepID=A0A418WV66_9BURK|nr:hypothetical protein [Noviherbaspirillum cavernae]RJF96604.1 hypothetical protein D3870_19405 [Noviherbaspirillum cavernae]